MIYNETLKPDTFLMSPWWPAPKDLYMAKLKQDIDNGLLKYLWEHDEEKSGEPPKIN